MTFVVLRRYVPPLLLAMLLSAQLSACSGGDDSKKVRLGKVSRSDVAEVVEAPATVAARASATLRAPAEGTVKRLYVTEGESVSKGQTLVRIDSPSAREQLRQAREADGSVSGGASVPAGINLDAFQRQTDRNAARGFEGARKVAKQIPDLKRRAVILAEIAKAEAQYRSAALAAQGALARLNAGLGSIGSAMNSITTAQRVQTRAAVRAAERTVQALTIKAPFTGVVSLGGPAGGGGGLSGLAGQLPAQLQSQAGGLSSSLGGLGGAAKDSSSVAEGAPVSSGDALVTVTDISSLSLNADVDETDVLQVKPGAPADVELDAAQGATYTAEVTGVGVTPKESTGGGVTYKVTLTLERGTLAGGGPAPWPKPGMSAVVNLRVREVTDTISVPSSAIVTSGRDATVWLVTGGHAERRVVKLGAQGDTVVQVMSGLDEGEQIVIGGADSIKPGQTLQ